MRRADWRAGVTRITDLMHTRNRRADLEHRRRLDLLDAQYRCAMKRLQHREACLRRERERDALLRVCQPKATVRRNMREIALLERCGPRPWSSRSLPAVEGARPPTEAPSEPPAPQQQRPSTVPWLSIRQMREVAAIDSIAVREKAWREQRAREELQRLEDREMREMAALRRRIKAFNDTIGSVGGLGRPASTGNNRERPGTTWSDPTCRGAAVYINIEGV